MLMKIGGGPCNPQKRAEAVNYFSEPSFSLSALVWAIIVFSLGSIAFSGFTGWEIIEPYLTIAYFLFLALGVSLLKIIPPRRMWKQHLSGLLLTLLSIVNLLISIVF